MLRNKLNPAQPHQLTAGELVAIYHATGDDTLFDGLLLECGLTAVKVRAADMDGRPVAQRALDTTAHVAGLAAQTSTVLSKGRVTKRQRNALVGGLMAGVEQLMLLATEVEEKYHTVPGAAIAADIIRAGFGA